MYISHLIFKEVTLTLSLLPLLSSYFVSMWMENFGKNEHCKEKKYLSDKQQLWTLSSVHLVVHNNQKSSTLKKQLRFSTFSEDSPLMQKKLDWREVGGKEFNPPHTLMRTEHPPRSTECWASLNKETGLLKPLRILESKSRKVLLWRNLRTLSTPIPCESQVVPLISKFMTECLWTGQKNRAIHRQCNSVCISWTEKIILYILKKKPFSQFKEAWAWNTGGMEYWRQVSIS